MCAVLLMSVALVTASSYNLNFLNKTEVGSTVFKAGDCKLTVANGKAVITQGKVRAEASVRVETVKEKIPVNTFRLEKMGDRMKLLAIGIGGTKTNIVLVK
jgi:hypothetical protein